MFDVNWRCSNPPFQQRVGKNKSKKHFIRRCVISYSRNFIEFCIYKYRTSEWNTYERGRTIDQSANMATVSLKQEVEVAWQ